ncbi:MAG: FG-GAP-like repeat-containing protein, partial [Verrucomicrobiota bacterium]
MRFLLRISPNPGKVAPSLLSSLALFLTANGWHGSPTYAAAGEDVAAASHTHMLEVLDELERNVHEQNSYLSDLQIKKSLETLSSLPPDASPGERGIELGFLGFYYLAYGSTEKAIETLEEAREILAAYGDIEVNPELRRVEGSLALAYMRLAENQNCCADASPESCIFPIRGEAIHDREVGARKALELFKRSIETRIIDEPIRYREMWLANVALMVLGESADLLPETWRIPEEFLSQESDQFPKFTNVAATAGVDTFSLSGGSIADDFDGDGIFDLVVSRWEPYGEMRYLRGGEGMVFEDLTSESNLAGIRGGLNLKQVDFDNDGDLDIYVMRGAWLDKSGRHPNSLLRSDGVTENGGVRVTDIPFAAGLGGEHFPSQTADWADIDLDGDLDLFIG